MGKGVDAVQCLMGLEEGRLMAPSERGCNAGVLLHSRVTVANSFVVTTSKELQENHLNVPNTLRV